MIEFIAAIALIAIGFAAGFKLGRQWERDIVVGMLQKTEGGINKLREYTKK